MGTLTIMKFDVSRTIYEHVIEMIKIAAKLKSLGINVDENFIVQFIINSLTSKYSPFQMNYNTMKDKWNVNELHIMLVQEETRLKNQGTHSIHLINDQIARKKTGRKKSKVYCPSHTTRIVESGNASFFENGEVSGSEELHDVAIQEVRVQVPLSLSSFKVIVPHIVEQFNNLQGQQINDQTPHNEDIVDEPMVNEP
ncbi:hypothetical protein JRO89_XS04G0128700 [Xanthoceras sorbifolium]|uniref:Uncharacterized protein n=1 Tax=Xanthoceras sorbifolium TaxID=99658 RepID=A0ABQ8I548_9ROSI|nr:hypothetical protein JRO89_XS04G0128700 [Xanthoceras sorbifolium]